MLWTIAGAGLLLVNALSYPLSRALEGMDVQLQSLIFNLIYYLPFVGLPVLLMARRRPGMFASFRPYSPSLFGMLGAVSLAVMSLFFTTDLIALWSILLEAMGLSTRGASMVMPATAPELALCLLYVAVLPAVCEEFLFRGAVLSAYEHIGTRRAMLVSAALFATLHGSITGLPAHFALGLILGWLAVCCDSVYAALIYHTTYNAASVLLQFYFSRHSADTSAAGAETSRMLDVVGGLPGAAQLLVELLLMGAVILFSLRIFRSLARLRGVAFMPRRSERLRTSEWVLLAAGLLITAVLFAADLYSMLP